MNRAELTAWIDDLRGVLKRGELTALEPIVLVEGYRPRDAEETAQDLLERLDIWWAKPVAAR